MVSMTTIDRHVLIDSFFLQYIIIGDTGKTGTEIPGLWAQPLFLTFCTSLSLSRCWQGTVFKDVENSYICRNGYLHTTIVMPSLAIHGQTIYASPWFNHRVRYSHIPENHDYLFHVPMFSVGFGTRFITVVGDQGAKQQIKLQIWDTVCEWMLLL